MSNTQAIRKQLVAAIIMVLVAAIALGASTYAWFVNSTSVTANGMVVQAQSESGLLIRAYDSSSKPLTWNTTASGGLTTGKTLLPTSTTDGTFWTHAEAAEATASKAKAGTYSDVTSVVNADTGIQGEKDTANKYTLTRKFDIKASAKGGPQGLYVKSLSITTPEGADAVALNPSLRVLIVCGSNKLLFGSTSASYAQDVQQVDDASTDPQTLTDKGKPTLITSPTTDNAVLVSSDTKITTTDGDLYVTVYVFYEGEDTAHDTNNYGAQDLTVSIDFAAIA